MAEAKTRSTRVPVSGAGVAYEDLERGVRESCVTGLAVRKGEIRVRLEVKRDRRDRPPARPGGHAKGKACLSIRRRRPVS